MKKLKIFQYLETLDAFIPCPEYAKIAEYLGVTEWTPVVWICRYLMLDNDCGEHLFDNWDEREALSEKARALEIDPHDLLVLVPSKFQDSKDGPCHSDDQRKAFWTDVLCSMEIRLDLIFDEARRNNDRAQQFNTADFISDLDERIAEIESNT